MTKMKTVTISDMTANTLNSQCLLESVTNGTLAVTTFYGLEDKSFEVVKGDIVELETKQRKAKAE
jgi:hypothetical protein